MKSNLVLTPVTDKNGVVTKRWVKPTQPGAASATPIPPVQQPTTMYPLQGVDRVTLLGDLYRTFNEDGDKDEYDIDEVTRILKTLDDHSLRVITSFVINGGYDIDRIVLAAEIMGINEDDKTTLNETLSYYDVFSEETYGMFRENAIMKLHMCVELPDVEDYSMADEETQREVRRLLKSAEEHYLGTYDPDDGNHNIILGEKMREFIRSNMDQLDRIDEIMIERKTEDPVLIKSIMDSETPSISSGIL